MEQDRDFEHCSLGTGSMSRLENPSKLIWGVLVGLTRASHDLGFQMASQSNQKPIMIKGKTKMDLVLVGSKLILGGLKII